MFTILGMTANSTELKRRNGKRQARGAGLAKGQRDTPLTVGYPSQRPANVSEQTAVLKELLESTPLLGISLLIRLRPPYFALCIVCGAMLARFTLRLAAGLGAALHRGRATRLGSSVAVDLVSPILFPPPLSPMSDHQKDAAKSLVAEPHTIIHALDNILSSNKSSVTYPSAAHHELLRALVEQCTRLSTGDFVDSNGAHARLLQGPKGIGKTTILRKFVYACQAAFPSIIPIYITFNDMAERDSPLRENDIMQVIAEVLRSRGIDVASPAASPEKFTSLSGRIVKAMKSAPLAPDGKPIRLLIIADEIDQLYRSSPSDSLRWATAQSCLGNLAFLGDRSTGHFSVMLCGSSAICPLLITCNAPASSYKEFPLLDGASSLNGSKFRVWRIPCPLPTDVTLVKNVVATRHETDNVAIEVARLVAFVAGGTARIIGTYAGKQKNKLAMDPIALQARFAENNESAQRRLDSDGGLLYTAILAELRARNEKMMKTLQTDGRLDPKKVAEVQWEKTFKPIPWADIRSCWIRMQKKKPGDIASEVDMSQLQKEILGLFDVGYLVYDELKMGHPVHIYPSAMLQLFVHNHAATATEKMMATWKTALPAFVAKFGYDVAVSVSAAGVQGAMQGTA